MAREAVNLTIEPSVIEALDEFAKLAGLNRSSAANMILKGILKEEPQELYETMINALVEKGKQKEAEVLGEVFDSL